MMWAQPARVPLHTCLKSLRSPGEKELETVVKSRAINSYTFRWQLIHGGICLGDNEGILVLFNIGMTFGSGK